MNLAAAHSIYWMFSMCQAHIWQPWKLAVAGSHWGWGGFSKISDGGRQPYPSLTISCSGFCLGLGFIFFFLLLTVCRLPGKYFCFILNLCHLRGVDSVCLEWGLLRPNSGQSDYCVLGGTVIGSGIFDTVTMLKGSFAGNGKEDENSFPVPARWLNL